jgi:23S rRNA pseudouridine2605 synthase
MARAAGAGARGALPLGAVAEVAEGQISGGGGGAGGGVRCGFGEMVGRGCADARGEGGRRHGEGLRAAGLTGGRAQGGAPRAGSPSFLCCCRRCQHARDSRGAAAEMGARGRPAGRAGRAAGARRPGRGRVRGAEKQCDAPVGSEGGACCNSCPGHGPHCPSLRSADQGPRAAGQEQAGAACPGAAPGAGRGDGSGAQGARGAARRLRGPPRSFPPPNAPRPRSSRT